jgi:DNA-binding PadR family transcriptional regulator
LSAIRRERPEPLTPAVFHVLLALSEGARHGYAILQEVEAVSGRPVGPGTIYGTLQRMEESGLVRETPAPSGAADGRRRYYELTAPGVAALRAEARRLVQMAELVQVKRLAGQAGTS